MQFNYPPRRLLRGVPLSRLTAAAAVLGAVLGGIVALGALGHTGNNRGTPPPAVVPVIGPANPPLLPAPNGASAATPGSTATSGSPRPADSATGHRVGAAPSRSAAPSSPPPRAYEGDASGTVLAGGAQAGWCGACPDGRKIRFIGEGGTLTFPNVSAPVPGDYTMTVVFTDGDTSGGRTAVVSVDGRDTNVYFAGNGDWNSPQTLTMTVYLTAGQNAVEFSNPANVAPDIAEIVI